jgi:hypothetical protein
MSTHSGVSQSRAACREKLRSCHEQQQVEEKGDAEAFEHGAWFRWSGSGPRCCCCDAGVDHGSRFFSRRQKKENPAVGTPGQMFLLSEFTVSSMRPGCCSVCATRALSGLLLLCSQLLFLFFYFLVLLYGFQI